MENRQSSSAGMCLENQGVQKSFVFEKHTAIFQAEVYVILSVPHTKEGKTRAKDLHLLR